MNEEHFNVRVFIEHVVKNTEPYPRNDPKPMKVVHPIEIKVTATSLAGAVRKAKAYLDIEANEVGQ